MKQFSSHIIGFRLDDHHFRRLEALAAASNASPSHEARRRLIGILEEQERLGELSQHLSVLEAQISELKHDLSISVEKLLRGGTIAPQEAEKWVRENLHGGSLVAEANRGR